MMGVNRVARGIFDPLIEFYRPLPPLAYLPLVIIWFGIGEFSKVYLIFLAIFAPMAIAARAGVSSVSLEQIPRRTRGRYRFQVIVHVICGPRFRKSSPACVSHRRGRTTLVAGEMVAATRPGYMVLSASEFLASDVVIMGIIVIGFFAFLFDLMMRYLERTLVPWKGKV